MAPQYMLIIPDFKHTRHLLVGVLAGSNVDDFADVVVTDVAKLVLGCGIDAALEVLVDHFLVDHLDGDAFPKRGRLIKDRFPIRYSGIAYSTPHGSPPICMTQIWFDFPHERICLAGLFTRECNRWKVTHSRGRTICAQRNKDIPESAGRARYMTGYSASSLGGCSGRSFNSPNVSREPLDRCRSITAWCTSATACRLLPLRPLRLRTRRELPVLRFRLAMVYLVLFFLPMLFVL
mmetsp:Transcript_39551/g.82161  ORF Transcript_39551/g.82161 Transcript_39551/m.82161 type:complete len:235 (-) Transcript_39551:37-741(-)